MALFNGNLFILHNEFGVYDGVVLMEGTESFSVSHFLKIPLSKKAEIMEYLKNDLKNSTLCSITSCSSERIHYKTNNWPKQEIDVRLDEVAGRLRLTYDVRITSFLTVFSPENLFSAKEEIKNVVTEIDGLFSKNEQSIREGTKKRCPKCKYLNSTSAKFCSNCGLKQKIVKRK